MKSTTHPNSANSISQIKAKERKNQLKNRALDTNYTQQKKCTFVGKSGNPKPM